ncbi:hypothetical protein [Parvimonas sp. G1604]|uniref:hypothetical protein n=1 Tax=Parvimonas sp. G1604 TaxID=3388845 RepID=UPI00398058AE
MERIIILNNKQFPAGFNSVDVTPPAGVTKISYVENRMIAAVNSYNPKLKVNRIDYIDIKTQFPFYKKGNSNGVLVEEFEINPANRNTYLQNGCYVYSSGTKCICRRIMMYLFVSGAVENTRTAFISQTVFPTLLEYADDYLLSPSYSIANHKFCFINILNKTITATMILRHLSSLCSAGMEYVEIFNNRSIVPSAIPKDLKSFLQTYSPNYAGNYNVVTDTYEDDNYKIEFKNKEFTWKANPMVAKLISKTATTVDFNGSAEKFYWIETLPMAIFAYKQGYLIDYSEYENFVTTYTGRFSASSDKFARCQTLLNYVKKYFI